MERALAQFCKMGVSGIVPSGLVSSHTHLEMRFTPEEARRRGYPKLVCLGLVVEARFHLTTTLLDGGDYKKMVAKVAYEFMQAFLNPSFPPGTPKLLRPARVTVSDPVLAFALQETLGRAPGTTVSFLDPSKSLICINPERGIADQPLVAVMEGAFADWSEMLVKTVTGQGLSMEETNDAAVKQRKSGGFKVDKDAERRALLELAFFCASPSCHSLGARSDFKLCSRCRVARYCSPECQKADWSAHKRTCASSAAQQ